MELYKGLSRVSITAAISAFGILSSVLPGKAVILSLGADAAPGVVAPDSGQVGNLDVSTGVFTPFIKSGLAFTDLALNDAKEIFGITVDEKLYSINQSSGSYTFIGQGEYNDLTVGLGFDKNNQLYATGVGGNFFSVNEFTGSSSFISNIPDFPSISDIVFNPKNNQFFATSSLIGGDDSTLFSLDLNGKATKIGKIGLGFYEIYGLAFDNGTLYAYTSDGKQLIIDQTTGAGVFDKNIIGLNGKKIFGAASSINETKSVPESSSLVSTIVAIFTGWWMLRKQKNSQSA